MGRDENWKDSAKTALRLLTFALAFTISSSAGAQPASPIYVSTKAALAATPSTYAIAVRMGFTVAGDSPPLTYLASASACSLSSGAGDGGSQVPTSDGGCWNAKFPAGGLRIEWWGVSQTTISGAPGFQLYVNKTGDTSNANMCVQSSNPCAKWQHAINQAELFNAEGGNIIIHDTDTTAQNFPEVLTVNGPLPGSMNGTPVPNIGSLDPGQIILDGANEATITGAGGQCAALAVSNNAIVGIENITLAPTFNACQSGVFVQLGGGVNVYGGVTFGATGSQGYKVHAENSAYGVEFWQPYTITGNGGGFASVGPNGLVIVSAGYGQITGTPTFTSGFIYVGAASSFQTNIGYPWGGVPAWNSGTTYAAGAYSLGSDNNAYTSVAGGNLNHNPVGDGGVHWTLQGANSSTVGSATGTAFVAASGGVIDTQLLPVAWPGNTVGIVRGGGQYREWPAASAPATSGLGTGGTATIGSGGSAVAAEITMTAGSGASATGTVRVSFPFLVQHSDGSSAACIASPTADGTGFWNDGTLFEGSTYESTPAAGMPFNWSNNGAALVNGSTYTFIVTCPAG